MKTYVFELEALVHGRNGRQSYAPENRRRSGGPGNRALPLVIRTPTASGGFPIRPTQEAIAGRGIKPELLIPLAAEDFKEF